MKSGKVQDQSQIKWISDFIWNIADNRLRDVYVRGKYRDVILPFTVLRRLDAVLEETKQKVLERKRFLDKNNVADAAALDVTTEFLLTESVTTPDEEVLDEAFFRKYKSMSEPDKKKIRKILDAWEDE